MTGFLESNAFGKASLEAYPKSNLGSTAFNKASFPF